MYFQAIKTLPAKGRYQRRMNIDYPVWIALYEFRAENGHKARQDYNVYRILLEQLFYAPFKNLLASALLFRYRYGVNAGIMCPYKRICWILPA